MLDRSGERFDYALVGGGLQNGLIALALLEQRPAARIALIEREAALGGNHVWCFHAADVPVPLERVIARITAKRWSSYDVMFPAHQRRIEQPYAAVRSARLDEVVRAAFAGTGRCELLLSSPVVRACCHEVELANGRVLQSRVVIVATGPERPRVSTGFGFQKFLGLELELSDSNAPPRPILMDARVPQRDGLRFIYVLPFDAQRILLEDTYFSTRAELDPAAVRAEVLAYASRAGYRVRRILREEIGILPMPTRVGGRRRKPPGQPFLAGYAGGFFHPGTGYSFPAAARLAELVARTPPEALESAWAGLTRSLARQFRYFVFLNRLLFGAFPPEKRYGAMERFYRLPEEVQARFYAMALTPTDRIRILCGKPPRGFSPRFALGGEA